MHWLAQTQRGRISKEIRNLQQSKGTNRMSYEGVTLPCGLKVKNGEIITEPQHDFKAINDFILKINSGPLPQTIAKHKAREEAQNKRRK